MINSMMKSLKYNICFFMGMCIILSACGATSSYNDSAREISGRQIHSTKDLLETDSDGYSYTKQQADQPTKAIDPLQAHMNARKQVKPTDRSDKRRYTAVANIPGDGTRIRTLYVGKDRMAGTSKGRKHSNLPFKTYSYTNGTRVAYVPPHQGTTMVTEDYRLYPPRPDAKPNFNKLTRIENLQNPDAVQIVKPQTKPLLTRSEVAPYRKSDHGLLALRKGEHEAYTRIVLDMDRSYAYTHEMLDGHTALIIKLPQAPLNVLQEEYTYNDAKFLKGITAKKTAQDGSILALNFRKPVRIDTIRLLKKTHDKPYRLMIDVREE